MPADEQNGEWAYPGIAGELQRRLLIVFFLIDASYSMAGEKLEQANQAVREAIEELRRAAKQWPEAQIMVRAIRFGDGRAEWHLAEAATVEGLVWPDVADAAGTSALGAALRLLAPQLDVPPMPVHTKRPIVVLVSDGQPTDDWRSGFTELLDKPWGRGSMRVAIGVGDDVDEDVLQEFTGDDGTIVRSLRGLW